MDKNIDRYKKTIIEAVRLMDADKLGEIINAIYDEGFNDGHEQGHDDTEKRFKKLFCSFNPGGLVPAGNNKKKFYGNNKRSGKS